MTPPRDVDELASALIDGLLDSDEAAAARHDPAVARRAAQMLAARDAVRDVPAPDPGRRDDAIAAALAAADALPGPVSDPVPHDPVADTDPLGPSGLDHVPAPPPTVPLPQAPADPPAAAAEPAGGGEWAGPGPGPAPGDRRVVPIGAARPRRWSDPRWLGAAAAVVLVLAVGGLLALTGGTDSDADQTASMDSSGSTTTAGGQANDESAPDDGAATEEGGSGSAGAGEDLGGSAPGAPERADPGDAPAAADEGTGVVDLGTVDSPATLGRRVRAALDERETRASQSENDAGPSPPAAAGGCPDRLAAAGAGPLVFTGRATLDGAPVTVWVHEDGDATRMVAVDASCTTVVDRFVPG